MCLYICGCSNSRTDWMRESISRTWKERETKPGSEMSSKCLDFWRLCCGCGRSINVQCAVCVKCFFFFIFFSLSIAIKYTFLFFSSFCTCVLYFIRVAVFFLYFFFNFGLLFATCVCCLHVYPNAQHMYGHSQFNPNCGFCTWNIYISKFGISRWLAFSFIGH